MPGLAVATFGVVLAACGAGSEETTTTGTSTATTEAPSTTTTEPPTTTADTGMAFGERIPGTTLRALVAGNDPEADRINLIFAPWGWDDQVDFEFVASELLSWDGNAYLVGEAGQIVVDQSQAIGAELGIFAIEPWRSARDRFNVWATDVEPEMPVSWLNDGEAPFDLPDQSVVILAFDPHRFNPDLTSVAGLEVHFVGPEPPSRPAAGNPFANAVVVIDSTFPASGLVDVPHELGHALFNLPDEYVGQRFGFDGRTDLSSWPSCAEDRAEADEWWADLVGDVDPMVDIWAAEMDESGFPIGDPAGIAASVTVSNVDQGCYGVTGSLRATFDSLMNNSIPVLGSVSRKWAMQILDLWGGAPRS